MKGLSVLSAAGAAFFLALAAYGATAAAELAQRPPTVTAEYVSMADSLDTEGRVLREELPVLGRGFVKLLAADGERVARGSVVARQGKREITAPQAGFFTSETGEDAPDHAIGKVVCSLAWQYETELQSLDCDKIAPGDRVTLRTEYGDFEAVAVEKSGCRVRFAVHSGIESVLCADAMSAELVYGEKSGYRLPASALRHDDEGDYVTVLTGGVTVRAAVYSYTEYGNELLVEGELRPGMEVVY